MQILAYARPLAHVSRFRSFLLEHQEPGHAPISLERVDIGKAACSASRFRYFPRTSKYGACVTSPAGRTLPDVAPP